MRFSTGKQSGSTGAFLRWASAVAAALVAVAPANAQDRAAIVRDAEIEALVRDYARPILQAAGLAKANIGIVLVNDQAFNAFVDGRRLFINAGTLMTAETPNEVIGVIAHEAGHLAGHHQELLRQQLARAQTLAIVSGLLGIGAVVAGAATDNGGLAAAGQGVAMGAPETIRRGLLSYQRGEEAVADRSALVFLDKTGQSARGMLKTFKRFQTALSLSGTQVDPYLFSHPMPRERLANLTVLAEASPNFDRTDPPALQLRHDMARVKIAAYTQGQGAAARLMRKDPTGLPARYGDAITTYLYGNPASALKKADALIKLDAKNPYFQELRGDILMKANRAADSASAYSKATKLDAGHSAILRIERAQALVATGKPDSIRAALDDLREALKADRENPSAYRYLAQAYGQLGEIPEAELATAEGHYYTGHYLDAKIFAARAQSKLKRGSPAWLRAEDIINFKKPKS